MALSSYLWGKSSSKLTKNISNNKTTNTATTTTTTTTIPIPNTDALNKNLDFPRVFEKRFGEILGKRTYFLKKNSADYIGLGLPDLIHINLSNNNNNRSSSSNTTNVKSELEIGQFFHITGADFSDKSMPLALLNIIQHSAVSTFAPRIITFSCYNFLSNLDLIIRFESITKYSITINDLNHVKNSNIKLNDNLWEEFFLCSSIRSIIINNDIQLKFPGLLELPLLIENDSKLTEKLIVVLCKFLNRYLDCGFDNSLHSSCSIINNYLTESLLLILSISPTLIDFTVNHLKSLLNSTTITNNDSFILNIVILKIYSHFEINEIEFISSLNEVLKESLANLSFSNKKNSSDSNFQLINSIIDLLNLQSNFLLGKQDYELALNVSKLATSLSPDSFESWYNLAISYAFLNDFKRSLFSINSMPFLPMTNTYKKLMSTNFIPIFVGCYYLKPSLLSQSDILDQKNVLNPIEMITVQSYTKSSRNLKPSSSNKDKYDEILFGRTLMPKFSSIGRITKIWNGSCLKLGQIYGLNSSNLTEFVSRNEINSIKDLNLLKRNTTASKLSSFQLKVYDILLKIITTIGWNDLLKLRSDIFLMEKEYFEISKKYPMSTDKNVIPLEFKRKKLCEPWLDQLFLDLYGDLGITSNYQSEESNSTKLSGLEWELLGLTQMRTWYWNDSITSLRTSLSARFDVVSCQNLLNLYLKSNLLHDKILMDYNILLDLLVKKIAYDTRFYDNFQIFNYQVLFKLCSTVGINIIRNRITLLPDIESGIITKVETMLEWVSEMITD
ncbi:hypothetical protein Kpol_463p11 [Vanderwaltozyma polyspora DSM 70294]|uniref:Uncharacterized protein n=1 Tax=Vanderwaltozyma polyspora (strain ATCC 22028 / DSM 70294 / BCRC 21397 / CBS 2163 / NBRC 10782 / NRRL Y-8283 / UCD 57-17) TaxID=436907 RepID=A7TQJ7_VANPO|nr:uncharacterized protein Kpol_463p11 [Vanderwaltozyma polyspora DSM 70294]EDO15461.1 hypothetical protein Kpol_463p11 [Vanderwaltozyma polyspora DSM 70294]